MAMSRSERNARARLRTILMDEDYGPKLARLRGRAEREVLDLIEAGRGKEARQRIAELDEQRRARRATRDRARRFALRAPANRTGPNRPTDETTEFWEAYKMYKSILNI